MNRVEDRINRAAAELRELTHRVTPPPLEVRQRRMPKALIAFAVTFAVVVAVGLIPVLLGEDSTPLGSTPTTALPAPSMTLAPSTTLAQDPNTSVCSAAGAPAPGTAEGLPEPVGITRQTIIDAAWICDLETLESVAGDDLNTSFGGGGFQNLRDWEEKGAGQLGLLLQLLDTSYGVVEVTDGPDIYVWPAAFTYESWDDVPDQYREELYEIFGEGEVDQIVGFGSYVGWRVGIDEEGDWLYFVAGD